MTPVERVQRDRRTVRVAVVLTLVAALLLLRDRGSLERGNRLFRSGDAVAAADVYDARARDGHDAVARYNLGTALLAVDLDSAAAVLASATEVADRLTAQRSLYNLGYRFLISANQDPDSTAVVLTRAIENNRLALRMDPSDQDARWNLSLAQRMLDALTPPSAESDVESNDDTDDEVTMTDPSLSRSDKPAEREAPVPEDPKQADNPGERQGPREGAKESWATQDPGPLTRAEALNLLQTVQDDPEALVRGLMWSRRPDVAWWSGQISPGGRW